jgi:hypothetical protein
VIFLPDVSRQKDISRTLTARIVCSFMSSISRLLSFFYLPLIFSIPSFFTYLPSASLFYLFTYFSLYFSCLYFFFPCFFFCYSYVLPSRFKSSHSCSGRKKSQVKISALRLTVVIETLYDCFQRLQAISRIVPSTKPQTSPSIVRAFELLSSPFHCSNDTRQHFMNNKA